MALAGPLGAGGEPPAMVLHVITRMILGGAQQNTLQSAAGVDAKRFRAGIVSGPQTGPEGSLHEAARARGVPLQLVPSLRRELRPLADLRALLALVRRFRRTRPSVVHTHSSKAGILGRWAAWLAGAPAIVHTVHGWSFHEHQSLPVRAGYRLLERLTAPITDAFVVVSRADLERGVAAGIGSRERYRVIRSAIDTAKLARGSPGRTELRRRWGLDPSMRVIGTVGRLSAQKDPLGFVACAAHVARRAADAHFVMIGDGPLRERVEERIAGAGLEHRFTLTGLVPDAAEQIPGFDVFVSSSGWEGLPRVLLEALWLGVPVVATDLPGSREALADGALGSLVAPGDPAALATAVLRRLGDDAPAPAAARQRVEMEFGLARMLADLDALYTALLAGVEPRL